MAKVLATLAQYNDDEGKVRERAVAIMNSFVWQVGLDSHTLMKLMTHFETVQFGCLESDLI